jgi:hypothetical protein
MKTLRILCWAVAIALLAAGTASAQRGPMGGGMGMAPPQFHGILNPTVGTGAAYQTETRGMKSDMEITVVGKEDVGGKPGYWLETAMNSPQGGGQMYMKMLMVVDGKNASVTRMIMQMAGQPPMEMPMQGMMGNMQQNTSTDLRDTAERVGAESVTTPAGTFDTEHYRAKDGSWDAWISPQIAPWGLVKSQARDTTMTLTRQITDAKDHITGTPQQFDPAQMMRGMGMGRSR